MKAKSTNFAKKLSVIVLSCVMLAALIGAVGCNLGTGSGSSAQSSMFYAKQESYVLNDDYTLSKADEKARKGGKNEVILKYPTTLDLAGHTLNLGGLTLTVQTDEVGAEVVFKNGTVTGGNLNVIAPNGDVSFDNVTVTEDVSYELEAASDTILMSNSTLKGKCTVKSDTRVQIKQSEVTEVTLTGSGKLEVGEGASLKDVNLAETAIGAIVKVTENAKVTGNVSVAAAAQIEIEGEVAKLDVKETVATSEEAQLNVVVKENANVLKIDLKAPATVELNGNVSHVTVSDENADVQVKETATVAKVEVKAAAEVKIEGNVTDVVVGETATGAKVDVKETAKIDNVIVSANDTEIAVGNGGSVSNVKVVENVTGTTVPDTIEKETITKEDAEKFLEHTHVYTVTGEVKPTCTENGIIIKECIDGDDRQEISVPALGHDYAYEIVKLPTETENGEGKYTCTRCGHSYTVVLKAESGTKITGFGQLLKAIFADGIDLSLGGTTVVIKQVETITENGITSTEIRYNVLYIEELNVLLDTENSEYVKGLLSLVAKIAVVDNLDSVDLTAPETIDYTTVGRITMYLDNDVLYGNQLTTISSETVNDIYLYLDWEQFFDYIKQSSYVPQPIKVAANLLDAMFGFANSDVDVSLSDVEETLRLIADKLGQVSGSVDSQKVLSAVADFLFVKETKEDGTVVYTLDFDKLKGAISEAGAMTISDAIDKLAGAGTAKFVKDFVTATPLFTVNELIGLANGMLSAYGIDINNVYAIIDYVGQNFIGESFSVEALIETYGPKTIAQTIAEVNGVTEKEATEMLAGITSTITGMMDQTTLSDVAEMIYQKVKSNGGSTGETEGETQEVAFIDMVLGMLDQMKQAVTAVITVSEAGTTVKVNVMGYEIYVGTDVTDGITVKGMLTVTEQIVAEVIATINANGLGLNVNAMDYYANVSYDNEQSAFTAVVGMNVPSTDEEGNTVITKQEMGNLAVFATEQGVHAMLTVMGVNMVDLNATAQSGEMVVTVPMGESALPVNVKWNVLNKVATVTVSIAMGEDVSVFTFVCDLSKEDAFTAEFAVGMQNGETYTEITKLLKVTAKNVRSDGKVKNVVVDYALDASAFGLVLSSNGSSSGDGSYSHTYTNSLEKISGRIDLKLNADANVPEMVKANLVKALDVIRKANVSFTREEGYDAEKISVTYKEEGSKQYYEIETIEQTIENGTSSGKLFTGTVRTETVQGIIPAKDGLISVSTLNLDNYCGDWYRVYYFLCGNFDHNETTQTGTFVQQDDLWVADVINEVSTTTSHEYRELNVSYFINAKTGETRYQYEHNYEVVSYEFLSNSKTCADGVVILRRCTECGKTYEEEAHGHSYKDDVKTFKNDCGTVEFITRTCVVCKTSLTYFSSKGHSITQTDSQPLTAEELAQENIEGAYYGVVSVRMCTECNLYITEKSIYVHDADGCKCIVITSVGEIDHKTGKVTALGEFVSTEANRHYTTTEGSTWYRQDKENDPEVLENALTLINENTDLGITSDRVDSVYTWISKCLGCGTIESLSSQFELIDGAYGKISVMSHEYGTESVVYYSESIDNAQEFLNTLAYKGFNNYTGKTATSETYEHRFNGDLVRREFRILFNDGDHVFVMYDYSRKDGVYTYMGYDIEYYVKSACKTYNIAVDYSDGEEVIKDVEEVSSHQYTHKCLGENCMEDGAELVCSVCGHFSYQLREHEGCVNFGMYITDGLYVEGSAYACCGSGQSITVRLEKDVTLTENVYLGAENITFNLNGYTLDLNGYDFILYGYSCVESWYEVYSRIVLTDDGRADDDGNLILGAIVNGATGESVFAISTKAGFIEIGNVNFAETVLKFFSDNIGRTELQDAILGEFKHEIVLNRLNLLGRKY